MHGLLRPELPNLIPRIVICASGSGSNFEAIVKSAKENKLIAQIDALIVDRECYALERAKNYGIPSIFLKKAWYLDFERIINDINPDLIVLAGFMRIIPPDIVKKYYPRIVNIHPSLLPSFPGKDGIKQAYEYGVKVTGITIHLVDDGIDTGPILFQKAIEIKEQWTLHELEEEIHKLEHEHYWQVINDILHKKYKIEGRKITWGSDSYGT